MKDIFQNIQSEKMEELIDIFIHDTKYFLKDVYKEEIISEIIPEREVLRDILTRVEKRRYYFYVFYNRQELGDINESALIFFWVTKLMPFKHINIKTSDLNVNIGFAFLIFTINYVIAYDKKHETKERLKFSAVSKRHLLYALKYRDMSKEAIMAIAESLIC